MATPIEITVNVPFDVIGSVLVPAAAVLVSAGIALWLAHAERKSAERARVRLELANLSRSLTALAPAALAGVDVMSAIERVIADNNVLAFHLADRDHALLMFVNGAIIEAQKHGNVALASTASWLANCVEAWSRNKLTSKQFTQALPSGAEKHWESSPRLSDWGTKTTATRLS